MLDGSRHVVRVYLYYVICALALCTENLKRLVGEVGSDYAVAHLALDECCCGSVAGVAERYEVAVRAHAVGTACTGIRTCNRRKIHFHVVNEVYLLQRDVARTTVEYFDGEFAFFHVNA